LPPVSASSSTAATAWPGLGSLRAAWLAIGIMALLRLALAATLDLRTDEAYYWTWSREPVLSFLDHPPMVAWLIRASTALLGQTTLGVRLPGVLAMAAMQLLLADIVRRHTADRRATVFAVLAPEATLYYGLMLTLIGPDVPLVACVTGVLWALVRLDEHRAPRWWLVAGVFAGLALLSKYTALMILPAVAAYVLWPPHNRKWLLTIWPWLALLVALALFSPALIWNAQHDWASFRFQFVRVTAAPQHSFVSIADFLGHQAIWLLPGMFLILLRGMTMTAWNGYRRQDAVAVLLGTAALAPFLYFLWRSASVRITATWVMVVWPAAFAATALNFDRLLREGGRWARSFTIWVLPTTAIGVGIVLSAFVYYLIGGAALLGKADPIGDEAGFGALADAAVTTMAETGASWIVTADYRTTAMLQWELKDRVPVIQLNERSRYLGWRAPDLGRVVGRSAIYVAPIGKVDERIWNETHAIRAPLKTVDRAWRGVVYDSYALQKVSGLVPDIAPPPGSPFYRWPILTGDAGPCPPADRGRAPRALSALASPPRPAAADLSPMR
jgi:4-amino-4-deoxy-L-arabinose transferase-like glycosyltransferase